MLTPVETDPMPVEAEVESDVTPVERVETPVETDPMPVDAEVERVVTPVERVETPVERELTLLTVVLATE